MKPSERIGNLLYNEKGEVVEVESITKTQINGVELSKWKPIPITLDLLEKLGLVVVKSEHWDDWYIIESDPFSIQSPAGEEYWFAYIEYDHDYSYKSRPFKYIHDIQNFHYELTGEDLIFKK